MSGRLSANARAFCSSATARSGISLARVGQSEHRMRKAGMLVEIQCLFELLNRLVGLPAPCTEPPPGSAGHAADTGSRLAAPRCDRQSFGGPAR